MPRLLVLLTVFLTTTPAAAQDALFAMPEIDQITRLLEPEKVQDSPPTAQAALDIYLQNCTQQTHPALDEERLIALCLCTASTIESRFDEAQILGMFGPDGTARALRESALRRAFTPCMPDTVHDLALAECSASPNAQTGIKNKAAVCACTAQGMAATLSHKADWLTDIYLRHYKTKAPDPLAHYLGSIALERDMNYNLTRCMRWHENDRGVRKQ